MKKAGLIYGPEHHHLDHIAPLCALEDIPLILTDDKLASLAEKYYPDLKILHWHPYDAQTLLVNQFDTIIYSTPRVLFDQVFYLAQAMQNKRVKTVWCPHGNSDKGRQSPFMEALSDEELILTYGPRIENFLAEKGVSVPTQRIGNYRLKYYHMHKDFYDSLLPKKTKPIVLYAPTWKDNENNTSFPQIWNHLLNPPQDFELIVKLHPHLYHQFPSEIEKIKKQVKVIEDFPPIYPLLAQADLYIGDMSSIGYDYLTFNRPILTFSPSELSDRVLIKDQYPVLFDHCLELLNSKTNKTKLYSETFTDANPLYTKKTFA